MLLGLRCAPAFDLSVTLGPCFVGLTCTEEVSRSVRVGDGTGYCSHYADGKIESQRREQNENQRKTNRSVLEVRAS